jgi:cold shock CspA family protein
MIKKQGILVKWNDEKGFGFIKSETDDKEVFIHISAIPKQSRCPQVGDTIIYDLHIQDNGKLKAHSATIKGAKINYFSNQNKKMSYKKSNLFTKIFLFMIIIIVGLIAQNFSPSTSPSLIEAVSKPNCKIKGNISKNSGKKYYHIQGMEDYENTVISPQDGEKWFCTEQEAISQGWVKAPR